MIKLSEEEIDVDELLAYIPENVGAVVLFIGVVRGDGVERIFVEAYKGVAENMLEDIRREAMEKFGVVDVRIVHRVGELKVGERIVAIAALSSHREEGFKACKYVIDELKKRVPIWKKEIGLVERWIGSTDR